MAEIYRVEKGSEEWKYKAYDYVRTDAFCCGQNIPIELEFGQDESTLAHRNLRLPGSSDSPAASHFRRKRQEKSSVFVLSEKNRKADTAACWSKPLRNG